MIKEAIEKILSLAPVETLKFNGQEYTTKSIHPVKPDNVPNRNSLSLSTLSGICDWFNTVDCEEEVIIHVENYDSVQVVSRPDDYYKGREHYLDATCPGSDFPFNSFIGIEEFVIKTSSKFVMTDELKKIIKTVSSIRQSEVVTVEDDGISQAVTASSQLNRVEQVQVSPFCQLKPFRTFREIEQPESRFLLRMKQRKDQLPEVALFRADNDEWKIEAMKSIKEYLEKNIDPIIKADVLM